MSLMKIVNDSSEINLSPKLQSEIIKISLWEKLDKSSISRFKSIGIVFINSLYYNIFLKK